LELNLSTETADLTARFEPFLPEPPPSSAVILTEFQYHPAPNLDSGDWIELHNRGSQPVQVFGWILRDDNDDREFLLTDIILQPGAYIVLCQDQAKFSRVYPEVTTAIGNFAFGLGNEGDMIRLYDSAGNPMLRIAYDDTAPWPPDADGLGRTVQLMDVFSSDPEAWTGSRDPGGSPGVMNP